MAKDRALGKWLGLDKANRVDLILMDLKERGVGREQEQTDYTPMPLPLLPSDPQANLVTLTKEGHCQMDALHLQNCEPK